MEKDYVKRDKMIFGDSSVEYLGGIARFGCLDVDTAIELIGENFLDPNDRQNDSPTAAKFIEFCEKYPQVKMHGYVVSPTRSDVRVTIEGLTCNSNITNDLQGEFIAKFYGSADVFDCNDYNLYCWWD